MQTPKKKPPLLLCSVGKSERNIRINLEMRNSIEPIAMTSRFQAVARYVLYSTYRHDVFHLFNLFRKSKPTIMNAICHGNVQTASQ